jgi:hypothetical protein
MRSTSTLTADTSWTPLTLWPALQISRHALNSWLPSAKLIFALSAAGRLSGSSPVRFTLSRRKLADTPLKSEV